MNTTTTTTTEYPTTWDTSDDARLDRHLRSQTEKGLCIVITINDRVVAIYGEHQVTLRDLELAQRKARIWTAKGIKLRLRWMNRERAYWSNYSHRKHSGEYEGQPSGC